jgi:hypothetical protein
LAAALDFSASESSGVVDPFGEEESSFSESDGVETSADVVISAAGAVLASLGAEDAVAVVF